MEHELGDLSRSTPKLDGKPKSTGCCKVLLATATLKPVIKNNE